MIYKSKNGEYYAKIKHNGKYIKKYIEWKKELIEKYLQEENIRKKPETKKKYINKIKKIIKVNYSDFNIINESRNSIKFLPNDKKSIGIIYATERYDIVMIKMKDSSIYYTNITSNHKSKIFQKTYNKILEILNNNLIEGVNILRRSSLIEEEEPDDSIYNNLKNIMNKSSSVDIIDIDYFNTHSYYIIGNDLKEIFYEDLGYILYYNYNTYRYIL